MARNVATLVIALLLALVAVLSWSLGKGWFAPADDTPDEPTNRVADAGATADRDAVEQESDAALPRTVVDAAAVGAPELELLVVHHDQPVPGAELLFHGPRKWMGVAEAERIARADGQRALTDSAGRARLPRPTENGYRVFAQHGELWGETYVGPTTEDGHRLEVELDRTVRARLLDGGHVPVTGAPISLASADWRGQFVNAVVAETDGEGIATFAHVQARVFQQSGGTQLVVGLDYPLPEPVRESVDLNAIPDEPIELRLPATGSVTIELVDDAGPFVPDDAVSLNLRATVAATGRPAHAPARQQLRTGTHSMPRVALGLRFSVELSSDECTGSAEFLGPRQAGQSVRQTIRVRRQPMMTGRIVHPDGEPFPGMWNAIYAATEKWTSYRVAFESGDDGRFRMPLPPAFGNSRHTTFVVEPAGRRYGDHRERPQGRVDLRRALLTTTGTHDLGDVVVAAMPPLVTGIVVDGRGNPVGGARLRVQHVEDGTTRETPLATQPRSGADGAFRVSGQVPDVGLHLVAYKDGYETTLVPFRPGATGLRVLLQRQARIVGKLLLAPKIRPQQVMVTWEEHATGEVSTMGGHIVLSDAGRLVLDEITPGSVTVSIRAVGASQPLVEFADVRVREGETAELPETDLREKLRLIRVRVVDTDGAPIQRAFVVVDPFATGSHREREAPRVDAGLVDLVLQAPRVDLQVHAPGCRPSLVRGVFADTTVELRRGIPVRLELDPEKPPSDQSVVPVLTPADAPTSAGARRHQRLRDYRDSYAIMSGDLSELSGERRAVGADGRVVIHVPAPGRYRVNWELLRGEDVTERRAGGEIDVRDTVGTQTFPVEW